MWRKANIVKLAVFVALAGSLFGIAAPSAQAAPLQNPENHMETATEQWLRYRALYYCFNAGKSFSNYTLSYDEVQNADFFNGESTAVGYLNEDGKVTCSDEAFVDNSARIMGWDGIEDMVCSMSIVDCSGSEYTFDENGTEPQESFQAAKAKLPDTADYPFNPPGYMWYYMYKKTLETFCGGGNALTSESSATSYKSKYAVSAYYVDPESGKITRVNYDLVDHEDGDTINDIYSGTGTGGNGDSIDRTCAEIADKTDQHQRDYMNFIIDWYNTAIANDIKSQAKFSNELKRKICGAPPTGGGDVPSPAERAYQACLTNQVVGRFNNAVDACKNSSDLNKVMTPEARTKAFKDCLKQRLPDAFNETINRINNTQFEELASASEGDTTTECAVDGVGWIVCPILTFVAELNDKAYSFLADNFLSIETELLTDNDTFAAWKSFRDIANVMFVIVFMIIIYSQLTSAGVSNYGIKRMLPRLVVAAVLVNLSYYVCQLAVDLSNILGASIVSLFDTMPTASSGTAGSGGLWETVVVATLATVVGVGLVVLVVLAPTSLIALGMILLILVARKALVILLVVVSPIAFVAYLLPNTEQFFKRWYKMFGATLMVYPIIGAVFGASLLAATILNNAAGSGSGDDAIMLQLTALGVSAIPLFAVPVLLKGSLSAAGAIGQRLAGLQDKANARAKRGIKEGRLGEAKTAWDARQQANKVGRRVHGGYIGKGRVGRAIAGYGERRGGKTGSALQWVGAPGKQIDQSKYARVLGADRGAAAATAAYHREANEETERQQATMSEMQAHELLGVASDVGQSSERRAAALRQLTKVGGHQHIQSAYDYLMQQGDVGGKDIGDVQQLAAQALLERRPAGTGKSQANALVNGKLRSGVDAAGNSLSGYNASLRQRLRDEKWDERQFAAMDVDDLARFAQMKAAGKLDANDVKMLKKLYDAAKKNPNIQLAGEQVRAIEQAINGAVGSTPTKVDGATYDATLTTLAQPNTP